MYRDAACWWPCDLQAGSLVRYTTSCKHSLLLLRMGEIVAQNLLSWLLLSIKLIIVASSWLFILLFRCCTATQTSKVLTIVSTAENCFFFYLVRLFVLSAVCTFIKRNYSNMEVKVYVYTNSFSVLCMQLHFSCVRTKFSGSCPHHTKD